MSKNGEKSSHLCRSRCSNDVCHLQMSSRDGRILLSENEASVWRRLSRFVAFDLTSLTLFFFTKNKVKIQYSQARKSSLSSFKHHCGSQYKGSRWSTLTSLLTTRISLDYFSCLPYFSLNKNVFFPQTTTTTTTKNC